MSFPPASLLSEIPFFLPAKSQLLHQIITWTSYSDSARGADNGHCHGLSARAGNTCVSPYCDTGQLGLKPFQGATDGLRADWNWNGRLFLFVYTENRNHQTTHLPTPPFKHLHHTGKYLYSALSVWLLNLKKNVSAFITGKLKWLCALFFMYSLLFRGFFLTHTPETNCFISKGIALECRHSSQLATRLCDTHNFYISPCLCCSHTAWVHDACWLQPKL